MLFAIAVQIIVCVLILSWLLKHKGGEKFSAKAVCRFLLCGALAYVLCTALSLVLDVNKKAFWHLNPLLAGFLSAFLMAALVEEGLKYPCFRLAAVKKAGVVTRHDAVIAAIIVAIGFTILEDIQYTVFGSGSVLRAILPAHLLFQGVMGYYYGKAKTTGKPIFHVLSLLVPILLHTLFDAFLIGMRAGFGLDDLRGVTAEQLQALPFYNYMIPMLAAAIAVMIASLVGLIVLLRKIRTWNRDGQLQEPLDRA